MGTVRLLPALMLCLSGCAVGPDFHRPAAPAATGYGAAPVPETASAGSDIPAEWWTLFQSPPLNRLVAAALQANPDVGAAQAALRQAHELYLAQWGSYLPAVQGSVAGARSQYPTSTLTSPTTAPSPVYSLYTAQLQLSYTPDVFGGTRRAVEQARAQEAATRYQLEATYLTLTSNVVATAIQEAGLRGQIEATRRLIELQHQLTGILQGQRAAGTASDLDLLAQQAAEAQALATLPPLQKQLGLTRDMLTALLGRLPDAEPADEFRLGELTLPTALPYSIPAQLLGQRPDVRAAEENLHAASAADGVALANLLPQFALTADVGSSALALRQLFTAYTGFWDAGLSLSQVLFQGGTLYHRHRAADAALDQAGAQYRGAVILACQNVADTLRALQADADALEASTTARDAAARSFGLARQQLQLGTISTVALLNAEQGLRQAEVAVVQAQANRYADVAALFQALGGGWWNRVGEPHYEPVGYAGR
jgi:NodT family efflux transporter outer membrane factor (OMF) lipoprotein